MSSGATFSKQSVFYSLPITIGSFFREVFAVTLLIVLQERAGKVDFFTQGLILLLVFLALRVPYINSYTLLFEAFSIGDWKIKNHVGMRKYEGPTQNLLHVLVIFAAHICGALAAAATRVYFDVMYGSEHMYGNQPFNGPNDELAPSIVVNVDNLRRIDSFWGGSSRLARLAGINGTIAQRFPMSTGHDLGIGSTALTVWYTTEEIGYVFILCVCYIHIWLSTGVGENKKRPLNPFSSAYWRHLFKVCLLVVLLYMALYRAFPTAHGSLHSTIYKAQYQVWNPTVKLLDDDNSETFARVFGGFLGLFLAVGYNKILVGTEKQTADDERSDFYYKLVWGLEPDPNHSRARRTEGEGEDDSSDEESAGQHPRKNKHGGGNWARVHSAYGKHCSDPACLLCGMNKKPDVKLRIPRAMDHPK